MSDAIDDGGPAFPFAATFAGNAPMQAQGISLRDWFAGQVLAGMCANRLYDDVLYAKMAREAYIAADAMLAARKVLS
jgi:hypothetical protein